MKQDCCKEAWIEAVNVAGRIFNKTIRDAMNAMNEKDFIEWLKGFVSEDSS